MVNPLKACGWKAVLCNRPLILIAGLFLASVTLAVLGQRYAHERQVRGFATFSERLVQALAEQQLGELEKLARDYAVWDDFFEHADGRIYDQQWLERNVTDSLYRNFSIADAFVLTPDSRIVYAIHRGKVISPAQAGAVNHELADILARRVRANPGMTSLSGVISNGSELQLAVAESIRPRTGTGPLWPERAWLVLLRPMDEAWMEETARLLSIGDMKIESSPPAAGIPRYLLQGLEDEPAGWVSWQVRPVEGEGTRLYPVLAGLVTLFFFIALLARSALTLQRQQLQVQKRLLQQSETLRHLSRLPHGVEDEVHYLAEVARQIRKTLPVGQVSVWRNDIAHSRLQCVAASGEPGLQGACIPWLQHGDLYRTLIEQGTLVIDHVGQSRLQSLREYWSRHGVISVLGAAVMVRGRLRGVLAAEATGHAVVWQQDQISFVAAAADLIAVAFESVERSRTEAALHHQQHFDALTGLPNQARLHELLQQCLQQPDRALAYSLWSVGGLRHVNDQHGRAGGDFMLQEIAHRLARIPGETVVARMDGNRFVLILLDRRGQQLTEELERTYYRLQRPVTIGDAEVTPVLSCGVSLMPQDARTADDLLHHAEFALESARSRNESPIEFFSSEANAVARERYRLAGAIPAALLRGEFELYYQPLVELASCRIVGAEILLRWHHPEKGLVLPRQFIPIAEETGQIHALGQFLLDGACRALRHWQDASGRMLTIAVNVSALQLRDPAFPDFVRARLHEQGLAPEMLELEITESLSIELFEQAPDSLQRLREMGVGISIDDFGTGYSSLSCLGRMPVNKLKIDRSFIERVPGNRQDADLARMIIALGKILDMTVVGEGIETGDQLSFLQEHGCHIGQGNLFSRPVTARAFANLLREGPDQSAGPLETTKPA